MGMTSWSFYCDKQKHFSFFLQEGSCWLPLSSSGNWINLSGLPALSFLANKPLELWSATIRNHLALRHPGFMKENEIISSHFSSKSTQFPLAAATHSSLTFSCFLMLKIWEVLDSSILPMIIKEECSLSLGPITVLWSNQRSWSHSWPDFKEQLYGNKMPLCLISYVFQSR